MRQSEPEKDFALHCQAYGLNPVSEFRFHPERRWRSDFAFPESMILVEIEGGVWVGGRHSRGAGYSADCEKYSHAALMGYRVFRFTPAMVKSGEAVRMIKEALDV